MKSHEEKLTDSLLKSYNEYYRAIMSEKIKAGIKNAKEEGKQVFKQR